MPDDIVSSEQFEDLLINGTAFLDVRAEVEFAKGRFPTSHNIPILRDEERRLVGTCYKQKGREPAIELGHQLVSGQTKEERIKAWCDFASSHENTHIYCWRGGMRSKFARRWMAEAGVDVPLIEGGFKALRRVIIDQIEEAAVHQPILRLGGKTGTAKTVLLNALNFSTDLERHANHRGSSFGRRVSGVPSQVDFENALGIDLLRKRRQNKGDPLIVEDECRRIGTCMIPQHFFEKMRASNMVIVEMPMEFRVQHIIQEYVIEMEQAFMDANPETGWSQFVAYLTQSLIRVQKRLGLEKYKTIAGLLAYALDQQGKGAGTSAHMAWVTALLEGYYDPMYSYQLAKQKDQIVFQGSYDEVLHWIKEKGAVL